MGGLGWEVATEDANCKPFAKALDALGVNLNLDSLEECLMGVSHNQGRVDQIIEGIKNAVLLRSQQPKPPTSQADSNIWTPSSSESAGQSPSMV